MTHRKMISTPEQLATTVLSAGSGGDGRYESSTTRSTDKGSLPSSMLKSHSPLARGTVPGVVTAPPSRPALAGNSRWKASLISQSFLCWADPGANLPITWSGKPGRPAESQLSNCKPLTLMRDSALARVLGGLLGRESQCVNTVDSIEVMTSFWCSRRKPTYASCGSSPLRLWSTQAEANSAYLQGYSCVILINQQGSLY